MRWTPRFANGLFFTLCFAATAPLMAGTPNPLGPQKPMTMSFTKGDTRNGQKIQLRFFGDSLAYSLTLYSQDAAPQESHTTIYLNGQRLRAYNGVMGELPRYSPFGSCYGHDMRYYMIETAEGKFYRSLPERAGKCYLEEPGIWSLFQDLDDLLSPPDDLDYQEPSAS